MAKSLFEELGGKYERQGDYLIPCLTVPAEEEQAIGIWGQRHLDYLKQYRKVTYTNLLTSGRLNAYLADINRQAQERFERLIEGMKQAQGITEQLKAENALEWTGCLNNIRACAKVSDKIQLLNHLVEKCNTLLIGGGMAYTFLKAEGYEIGDSLVDDEKIDTAKEILQKAKENNVKIVLPVDFLCATEFSPNAKAKKFKTSIPAGYQGLDIGPKTIKLFKKEILIANSIIWNGPLGVSEFKNFSKGTVAIAKLVLKFKGKAVIGGGDSAKSIEQLNLQNKINHVSTGGGAALKLIEGVPLPGLQALSEKL